MDCWTHRLPHLDRGGLRLRARLEAEWLLTPQPSALTICPASESVLNCHSDEDFKGVAAKRAFRVLWGTTNELESERAPEHHTIVNFLHRMLPSCTAPLLLNAVCIGRNVQIQTLHEAAHYSTFSRSTTKDYCRKKTGIDWDETSHDVPRKKPPYLCIVLCLAYLYCSLLYTLNITESQ